MLEQWKATFAAEGRLELHGDRRRAVAFLVSTAVLVVGAVALSFYGGRMLIGTVLLATLAVARAVQGVVRRSPVLTLDRDGFTIAGPEDRVRWGDVLEITPRRRLGFEWVDVVAGRWRYRNRLRAAPAPEVAALLEWIRSQRSAAGHE